VPGASASVVTAATTFGLPPRSNWATWTGVGDKRLADLYAVGRVDRCLWHPAQDPSRPPDPVRDYDSPARVPAPALSWHQGYPRPRRPSRVPLPREGFSPRPPRRGTRLIARLAVLRSRRLVAWARAVRGGAAFRACWRPGCTAGTASSPVRSSPRWLRGRAARRSGACCHWCSWRPLCRFGVTGVRDLRSGATGPLASRPRAPTA